MSFSVQNSFSPGFEPGETRRLLLQAVRGMSTEKQCALARHLTPILCKNLPLAHKILKKISQKVQVGLKIVASKSEFIPEFKIGLRNALLVTFQGIKFLYPKEDKFIRRLQERFNKKLSKFYYDSKMEISEPNKDGLATMTYNIGDESYHSVPNKITLELFVDDIQKRIILTNAPVTINKLARAIKERIFPKHSREIRSINNVELNRFFKVHLDNINITFDQLLDLDGIFELLDDVRDDSVEIEDLSGPTRYSLVNEKNLKMFLIALNQFTAITPWLLRGGIVSSFYFWVGIDYFLVYFFLFYNYNYSNARFVPRDKKVGVFLFNGLTFVKAFSLYYLMEKRFLGFNFWVDTLSSIVKTHLMTVGGLSVSFSLSNVVQYSFLLFEILSNYRHLQHMLEVREEGNQLAMKVLLGTDKTLIEVTSEETDDNGSSNKLVEAFLNCRTKLEYMVNNAGTGQEKEVETTKQSSKYKFLVTFFDNYKKTHNINDEQNKQQLNEGVIKYLYENGINLNSEYYTSLNKAIVSKEDPSEMFTEYKQSLETLQLALFNEDGKFSKLRTAIHNFKAPTSSLNILMVAYKTSIFFDGTYFKKAVTSLLDPLISQSKSTVLNAARTSSNPIISTFASAVLQKLLKGVFFATIQKLQSGESPKMAVKSVSDQLLRSNDKLKLLPYEKELKNYGLVKDDVLYQVYTRLCNTSLAFSPPAGLFNFSQGTRGLIARYATLSRVDEMQNARGVFKSIKMKTGPEIALAENARSCEILSNMTSLKEGAALKKDLDLTRRSDSLFALTFGKLFLRKSTPLDVQYGPNLHSVSLNAVFHSDKSHISTRTRRCEEDSELLSLNDLYQSVSNPVWVNSRFTKESSKKLGFELQLFQSKGKKALFEIFNTDPTKYLSHIICNLCLMPDIFDIDAGVKTYRIPALRFLVDVLKKETKPTGFFYKSEAVNMTEVLPKAFFLKTAKLDLSNSVHETPEYKGVEYLLSRAYFGNLRLRFKDGTCHDLTEDVLHFMAAALLYRKSDLFVEPDNASLFWNQDVSGTILEKVFNAMKKTNDLEYDSYNSSSGVPVFGNGGSGGVAIVPKGFCSTTSSEQTSTEAHVVSLLRGICARYAPGARQAAAY